MDTRYNRYYINAENGAEKTLTLTMVFSETGIVTYPSSVIITSNNQGAQPMILKVEMQRFTLQREI